MIRPAPSSRATFTASRPATPVAPCTSKASNKGNLGFDSAADLRTYKPIRRTGLTDAPVGADREGPTGVVDPAGTVHIFARGTDSALKHWYWGNGWQYDVPGTGIG